MNQSTTTPGAPLRIIHYSPGMRLELGGVVRSVLDWCTVLAARGHDVTLVAYDSPDVPADWNGKNGKPKVVFIPPAMSSNFFVPKKAVRIWRDLLTGGGVAHLHCPWTASNIQMSKVARELGVPYVVSIHGMLDEWSMQQRGLKKKLFLSVGGRKYMCAANRLHYTATAEREQAERWVPGAKAAVLPYLVDLGPFQALPGKEKARAAYGAALNGEDPKLLFLSRLHEKKGVHVLIEAAALLRKKGRKFKLLLAGTGSAAYEGQLREQTKRLQLEDVVTFLGLVTGMEKISLYQAADVFVLPTQQENFGLVLIEALAAGTPVVTTRGTDIWKDIAAAGGTISEYTPGAICGALDHLLEDRGSLPVQGQRGRDWVMQNLNTEKLAGDYEKLYAEVISEQAKKGSQRG
jgi:glycosyltransferase involved in cell wall biosynthesis